MLNNEEDMKECKCKKCGKEIKGTGKTGMCISCICTGKWSGKNNPMYGSCRSGENNPMYGKQHTPDTIKKLRDAGLGKHPSKETLNKRSIASSGENNGRWIKDRTKVKKSEGASQWFKKQCKKRDNYECQVCGSKENLHVHHIFQVKDWPGLKENLNNGVTLCKEHHDEHHFFNGK